MMKTRKATARFIEGQLRNNNKNEKHIKPNKYLNSNISTLNEWHYGLCELRDLMDYIFDGIPENHEQTIRSETQINKDRELLKQIDFLNNYGNKVK